MLWSQDDSPLVYPRFCTVCYDKPWQTARRRNPLRLAACSCIFWPSNELETWFYRDIPGATKTAEYIQHFTFLRTKKKGTGIRSEMSQLSDEQVVSTCEVWRNLTCRPTTAALGRVYHRLCHLLT
jgi:hypothetical protein